MCVPRSVYVDITREWTIFCSIPNFLPVHASGCKALASFCVLELVQPDGWARGEREGYGEPCDVTSLSLAFGTG